MTRTSIQKIERTPTRTKSKRPSISDIITKTADIEAKRQTFEDIIFSQYVTALEKVQFEEETFIRLKTREKTKTFAKREINREQI